MTPRTGFIGSGFKTRFHPINTCRKITQLVFFFRLPLPQRTAGDILQAYAPEDSPFRYLQGEKITRGVGLYGEIGC